MMTTRLAAAIAFASLALSSPDPLHAAEPSAGPAAPLTADAPASFARDRVAEQHELEQRLHERFSRERMRADLEQLASQPHRAGSARGHEVARFIADQLRAAGLDAKVVEYVHYLSSPVSLSASIEIPDEVPLQLTEDVIPSDPFTQDAHEHPGWNAYSASGSASAQIVFANRGSRADFEQLAALGVDLAKRIVLMRYFGAGEAEKVFHAQQAGAAAVILYSDPRDDGYAYGDTYPDGPWRPAGSIMRRSVVGSIGDPLSPGWASRPGARRLSPSKVDTLPRIPVLPISYRDAEKILRRLAGPVAPESWQGGLPLTYHVGPGPVRVRVDVTMDNRDGRIANVIARIPGSELPDQWLVLGNHHDAWIYGAGDPSSGTAAMLELGRGLGALLAEGWRPRRTLILAFFDAEEITLGGATEWMEDHASELAEKALAVLNMDSAVFNPDRPLTVYASDSIRGLWLDAARAVPDPRTGTSTYDRWLELQNRFRDVPSVDFPISTPGKPPLREPFVNREPVGDDQTTFYLHLALPVSDMYYGGDYGVYHSIYENAHWMKTIVDPDFAYHEVMASLLGTAALRMAQADLVPFDLASAAAGWQLELATLREEHAADAAARTDLERLERIAADWQQAAAELNAARRRLLDERAASDFALERWRDWNRSLRAVERSFFAPKGLPGSSWSRNLYYEGSTLPGLRWSLGQPDRKQFERQLGVYTEALQQARDLTRSLTGELREAGAAPRR